VFSLKLFGGVSLEGDGGALSGPAVQRHRLALLALLGASGPRGLTRDKLMAWLWPERDAERARGLLNQAVHVLRRTLGADAILPAGEDLQLNPVLIWCDVIAFEEAMAAGDHERAVGLYVGPFLDGFFLSDSVEFEQWASRERERLTASYTRLLETLAERASGAQDWRRAAEWWKRRVAQDPYDSRSVVRLMLALDASGNRAAAVLQAATHQRLLQEELGLPPSSEVQGEVERLRSASPVTQPRPALEYAAAPPLITPSVVPAPPGDEVTAVPSMASPSPRPRRLLPYVGGALLLGAVVLAIRFSSGPTPPPATPVAVPAPTADEIARAVARELARRQRGDTGAVSPQQRTKSIPAYELYLRGTDPVLLRSDSAARLGLAYLRQAVALDSTYAAAWAGLSRLAVRVGASGNLAANVEAQAVSEAAARRAIALDDSLAEAHATLGLVRMRQHDLAAAEVSLRRALTLDPDVALYREWLTKLYIWSGRPQEALTEAQAAVRLAPLSPSATAELARALLANGRSDEALIQLRKLAGLEPPLARVPALTAQCYLQKGMWGEAIAAVRPQAEQGTVLALGTFGYALARAGQLGEATRVLNSMLEREHRGGGLSLQIALVYLGLGDLERAVPFLESAGETALLSGMAEQAPLAVGLLDSLRGDPRIARLRRRLGLQNR
jgi:DNA-binding SARP family transcriptional activator